MSLTAAALFANVGLTGAAETVAGLKNVGTHVDSTQTGFGRLGGAASNLKNNLGSLITSPLGLLGLGGGLLTVGGIFEQTIGKASNLAIAVEKLGAITGDTPEHMSALLAVFDRFGVSGDTATTMLSRLEKNVGTMAAGGEKAAVSTDQLTKAQEALHLAQVRLSEIEGKRGASQSSILSAQDAVANAATKLSDLRAKEGETLGKLTDFEKTYGIQLTDTNGKVKDANDLVLTAADYFTSAARAEEKAAGLAKLFGKTWMDLAPVLKLGSQGILDAEQAAKDLGLTLTGQNAKDLADYQKTMRDTGDAVGGLELQIGLQLIPRVGDLAKTFTGFLTHGGSTQILDFFKSASTFAGQLGGAVQTYVVPAFSAIASAWGKVPDDLKKILIGGFVVNKLTGGAVTGLAGDAAKALLGIGGQAVGKVTGIGGLGVQHVWVDNMGIGGGMGGPVAAAGAGGAGMAATVVGAAAIAVVAAGVADTVISSTNIRGSIDQLRAKYGLTNAEAAAIQLRDQTNGGGLNSLYGRGRTAAAQAYTSAGTTYEAALASALAKISGSGIKVDTSQYERLSHREDTAAAAAKTVADAQKTRDAINHAANDARDNVHLQLAGALDAKTAIADGLALVKVYTSGTAKNTEWTGRNIDILKGLQARFLAAGDTATAAKLGADIAQLQGVTSSKLNMLHADLSGQQTALERIADKKGDTTVSLNLTTSTIIDGRVLANAVVSRRMVAPRGTVLAI